MGLSTEDVIEIQGLAARYTQAVDGGDSDAFIACFTEDGVFDIVGTATFEGHAALKGLPASSSGEGSPRHVPSNLVIEGDGDHATLKAYVHVIKLIGDPPAFTVTTGGVYNDTLVKEDGRWKFSHRSFTSDKPLTL
ncbi:MAG: nuclear transport factor 2 family protein [Acidimicrobiales bacterium]